ncbi:MAG: hypothetical protein IKC36_02790 [Clostridia bacterium]|nr:hypothetical protein [Clostridia bacterium]
MRKKQLSTDLARIKTVIEGDRKNVSYDVEKMLKYDLICVLGGYFDTCTPPTIEIDTAKGGIKVDIRLFARRVKSAGVRPTNASEIY